MENRISFSAAFRERNQKQPFKMKKILLLAAIVAALTSCKKENYEPAVKPDQCYNDVSLETLSGDTTRLRTSSPCFDGTLQWTGILQESGLEPNVEDGWMVLLRMYSPQDSTYDVEFTRTTVYNEVMMTTDRVFKGL